MKITGVCVNEQNIIDTIICKYFDKINLPLYQIRKLKVKNWKKLR